ncbi:hypothetical protein JHW43_000026 [Diplocarpon mali]|nr:hypothetical protein JHW43_000026 [Diplocarpon mali]
MPTAHPKDPPHLSKTLSSWIQESAEAMSKAGRERTLNTAVSLRSCGWFLVSAFQALSRKYKEMSHGTGPAQL